ncbi:glycosyltransferase family 4 protein [Aurantiacibacter gilvus]|uniref:Glycosyltransferase family 4 protein n=1 Tax=Aurantiacibacter gilvus TaxID=3139141 RepID=A0ABU9IHP5_9SPHN
MKLLFAIKGLVVSGGGAERVFVDVVNALRGRGHDVQVATFDSPGKPFFYSLDPATPVHSLAQSGPAQPTRLAELPGIMRKSRQLVRQERPDAVVAFMHSTFVPVGLGVLGTGVPFVASEHTDDIHYRTRRLQRWLRDAVFARSDAITIPTEASRQDQPERWQKRMYAIPNAIDFEALGALAANRRPGQVVLSVGRLMAEKDYRTLIQAFAQVAGEFPDWRLRIAGDGHLREQVEAEIARSGVSERIELPGYVRDIPAEYARAAIFASSSINESFGLVTAEALASGCPAIGFADCIGTAQLIEDGTNGLLVEPGADRVQSLANALRKLMADQALRERLGGAGPVSVAQYSLSSITDKWETMLENVCKRARA